MLLTLFIKGIRVEGLYIEISPSRKKNCKVFETFEVEGGLRLGLWERPCLIWKGT